MKKKRKKKHLVRKMVISLCMALPDRDRAYKTKSSENASIEETVSLCYNIKISGRNGMENR